MKRALAAAAFGAGLGTASVLTGVIATGATGSQWGMLAAVPASLVSARVIWRWTPGGKRKRRGWLMAALGLVFEHAPPTLPWRLRLPAGDGSTPMDAAGAIPLGADDELTLQLTEADLRAGILAPEPKRGQR